jgi:DNA-binding NtrC family response regulator
MPLELQVKLLRVLETGTFMRVGSTVAQETDVRVIAATNRVPEQAVTSGKLREDLLYRLNVFPIHLPPLQDRLDDIPLLADHFLRDICQREGQNKRFAQRAIDKLKQYRWPGNVRELRNVVQRIYLMEEGVEIGDEWLDFQPANKPAASDGATITVRVGTPLAEVERTLILATLQRYGNHKEKTAAALGVSLKTLYNRLKEYAQETTGDDAVANK